MSYVQFHDTLDAWSKANSLNTLTKMVLKYPKESPVTYKDVAEQVNKKIQEFVNENQENFFAEDLPVLEKIQSLLPVRKYKTRAEQKKNMFSN